MQRGVDYGMLTGAGVAIASGIVLLAVLATFKATIPAGIAMALQGAAFSIGGDIDTVASMAIPYVHEEAYAPDGMDVYIGPDHVRAASGNSSFVKPLVSKVYPGTYTGQGMAWNDTADMRERLNETLGATGAKNDPIDADKIDAARGILNKSLTCMAVTPFEIKHGYTTVIEKSFIYYLNEDGEAAAEAYVFIYSR